MTKKDMIKTIQKQEARRWESLQEREDLFGRENELTKKALCRWSALFQLMDELGIEKNRG